MKSKIVLSLFTLLLISSCSGKDIKTKEYKQSKNEDDFSSKDREILKRLKSLKLSN